MKISRKVVNGKSYIYALDSIYINRGTSIQKNKSLGPAETTSNIASKKKQFQDYLIHEEARVRIKYWQHRASQDFLAYGTLQKIEQLRASLYRLKRNIGELGSAAMETAFLVDFIYNSNKLEGSRVPRESVARMVKELGQERNAEVRNTITAINYLKQSRFTFTIKNIERLHDMLLAHDSVNLKYRTNNDVVVGNSTVSDYQNIKKELSDLLQWSKNVGFTLYPVEHAFLFYYKFERIHPFSDGNGRTGRILMNEILKLHKYHPIIIWNKNREAHMSAFQKAMNGNYRAYFQFMSEQFVKTHELYLKKIKEAYDLEQMLDAFLEPTTLSD